MRQLSILRSVEGGHVIESAERWRQPSPRLLHVRRLEVAAVTLVVAAIAGVVGVLAFGPVGGAVAAVVLVLGLVAETFVRRRVRAWGYAERDDDLLVQRGVLFSRLSVVPYGRMQFIDVTAGPIERSFGLATVRLHTAAAASDARIPGLSREEAARLKDRLAELGESQAAGL
jgi:membrane protein YdbS with pleckstrin-like domain